MLRDDAKSNVDLRDIIEGAKISCVDALDKFLVKVDPIKAIQDQDYFMKVLAFWLIKKGY